jgi:hypothetical protein
MTDLGDILERALGGNALNELLAQSLKTLLCCCRHIFLKHSVTLKSSQLESELSTQEEPLQLRRLCSYNSSSAFPTMSVMRRAEAPGIR